MPRYIQQNCDFHAVDLIRDGSEMMVFGLHRPGLRKTNITLRHWVNEFHSLRFSRLTIDVIPAFAEGRP